MAHFDPLSPPDAAYWLGHLRVARFDDLGTLSPSEIAGEFDRIWTDRSERSCAEQVLAEWDSAHGPAHLVLLGWYADEKSGRAVEAAAERGSTTSYAARIWSGGTLVWASLPASSTTPPTRLPMSSSGMPGIPGVAPP